MSKQVKYPIRVHITNNEEGKEPERLAFRVDGILFVGTRVEDKSTVTIYGGKDFVLLTLKAAIERICQDYTKQDIQAIKGHIDILFDALIEESTEGGAKA